MLPLRRLARRPRGNSDISRLRYSERLKSVTLFADASFCHTSKIAAYAARWKSEDFTLTGNRVGIISAPVGNATEAEACAIVNGLWLMSRPWERTVEPLYVLLQSDCVGAVQWVERTVVPRTEIGLRTVEQFEKIKSDKNLIVEIRHIPGHGKDKSSRTWVHNWCDHHARELMRQVRQKGLVKCAT